MPAAAPKAAVGLAKALLRVMGSRDWMLALGDDEERAWLLMEAACEELHPLGPVQFPSVHMLRETVDRKDRNDAIIEAFDGRNYRQLARRHRISTRQVRRIVDEPRRA